MRISMCLCAFVVLALVVRFQLPVAAFMDIGLIVSLQKYFSTQYVTFLYDENVTHNREYILLFLLLLGLSS